MMEYLLQTDKNFDMIYISNITDTLDQKESSALFQQCASHLKRDGKLVIWNNLVERKPSEHFLLMEELSHSISKNRLATYYGYFGVYGLR
jgi:spermidine synthase